MEGVLTQVYDQLDNFESLEAAVDESMEVDSGAAMTQLIKRQSSSGAHAAGAEILGATSANTKPRPVEFSGDFVQQKHSHKENSFRCNVQDRSTKIYVNDNMMRRRCVTATEKGLVCVLEDETVVFYASNSLLDPHILQGGTEKNQLYRSL